MPGSLDQLFGSGSDDDDGHVSSRPAVDDDAGADAIDKGDEYLEDEDADDVAGGAEAADTISSENVQSIEVHLVPTRPAESLYLLKKTTALDLDTRPFRSDHHQPHAEEFVDVKGITRYRAHDANCIRWRRHVGEDGAEKPQSNSRFVKWSDGTLQLLVGDEVFDVVPQDISKDTMYLYNNRTMWQAQGHLRNKLVVRPARLDHRFHNRVKAAVGDKQVKAAKVRTREDFANPEQEKAIQEKAIEERIRAEKTYARKQQQVHSSFSVRPAQRLRHDFNAEMLEEEDEEQYDEADLRYDSSGRGRGALSRRGGLDEDDEREAAQRLQSAKRQPAPRPVGKKRSRGNISSEEEAEEEDGEYDEPSAEDDSGEEGQDAVKPAAKVVVHKPKVKRGVVISSDEED